MTIATDVKYELNIHISGVDSGNVVTLVVKRFFDNKSAAIAAAALMKHKESGYYQEIVDEFSNRFALVSVLKTEILEHTYYLSSFWFDVKTQLPSTSDKVIITDGFKISTAHYFGFDDEGKIWWANQHDKITGFVENVTHWMTFENFSRFMLHDLVVTKRRN